MEAIRMDNVTRRFGNVTAVERLSLSVAGGELFGLVGPDGAGKTTAMRMLAATMDPTEGDVWVAGNHSTREPDAIKDSIAYMSQRFGLYSDLTVMQNINFYADIYGVPRKGRGEKIEDLLAFSNLTPFKKRPAGKLSGGMKQKLGLACALVHTPKVLLLDEPTNGVDPVSRRDFWRILYQLVREGVTIFVSTAYLDEAERCERLALLHKGHLMAVGTPEEVKSLIRGSILEVRSSEPRRAASVLRKALPGRQAGLFGDRVHLATANPEADKTAAAAALSDAGIAVEDIRAVTPSLEDVFISVIADEEKGPPMNSGQNTVVVKDLEKRFGSFVAVNRVSFEVKRGEIFGFLGPNGAGKSTTIRMLCGILAPTSGGGTVAGLDVRTQQEQIKANIGYMSQKFSLYEDLTVEENIDFYSGIYLIPKERKQERKNWVLEMAGLSEHRATRTGTLPGGWKQRLSLGCAMLHEPPVIFLDEPTSGVDPVSRRNFWNMIYDLADSGSTVFVTTHYMDEAEYCDRLALIYRGEIIAMDSPAALKANAVEETILDLQCDKPQDAMVFVEQLPEVKEAALFGRGLHIIVKDAGAAVRAIGDAMRANALPYDRLEQITPSMEDVFVSLIEARDRQEVRQKEVQQ